MRGCREALWLNWHLHKDVVNFEFHVLFKFLALPASCQSRGSSFYVFLIHVCEYLVRFTRLMEQDFAVGLGQELSRHLEITAVRYWIFSARGDAGKILSLANNMKSSLFDRVENSSFSLLSNLIQPLQKFFKVQSWQTNLSHTTLPCCLKRLWMDAGVRNFSRIPTFPWYVPRICPHKLLHNALLSSFACQSSLKAGWNKSAHFCNDFEFWRSLQQQRY